MEQNKIFCVILLLLLYTITLDIKLFLYSFVFLISGLLILNKKTHLSVIVLAVYLFSIIVLFKRQKMEKFQNKEQDEKIKFKNSLKESVGTDLANEIETKMNNDLLDRKVLKLSNPKAIQKRDSYHSMTSNNYKKVFFVISSLLDENYFIKNRENIESFLTEYSVNNLFDLTEKVLNKENNPIYNNFLEQITCLTNIGKVNYLQCDNLNYKKMYAFSELYYVYCLEPEDIVQLINTYKIYKLCDLSAKRYLLKDGQINTPKYDGLLYYLNEKTINDNYYDILKILELNKFLHNQDKSLRESLYNFNDKNKQVVKDLNSIMVLFDFYNVFDNVLVNYNEEEISWELLILKSADLNQPYWDTLKLFTQYELKKRIIRAINRYTKTDEDIFSIELDEKYLKKNEDTKLKKEEKIIEIDQCKDDTKELVILKELNLQYIMENFSLKINSIITEIIELFNNRCNVDCPEDSGIFSKYLYYFKEIMNILSKDERMFYVGLLIFVISLLMYFVNISK